MPPSLDVAMLSRVVEAAIHSRDLNALAAWAVILGCLADKCRSEVARTLGGTVTPDMPTGRLLDVKEAAALTGLPQGYFYRNAGRLSFTIRPSPGRIRFPEAELRAWASSRRRG